MVLQLHTPDEVLALFSDRARRLRLQAGWKQSTLSERSGVSLPTLRRFERTGRASLENFLRICHALGRLDELTGLLSSPPAQSLKELEHRAGQRVPRRGRR